MSCVRGCTGTPICSALDLCCIQFRQDCGKECDGLAVGYSTIQVDVNGDLRLCSNVGGVCTCTGIGGTDSWENVGNGTMRHIAIDGTIVDINVCDLIEADNCILLDIQFDGVGTTPLPGVIPLGTPDTQLEPPTLIILANPSDSDMECVVQISGSQLNATNTGGVANDSVSLLTQFTLDGVTWAAFAGQDSTAVTDAPGTPGAWSEIGPSTHLIGNILIPPGGSQTVGFRRMYRSLTTGFIGVAFADSATITTHCLAVP